MLWREHCQVLRPWAPDTYRQAETRNSAGRGGEVSALGSTSPCLWSWSHKKLAAWQQVSPQPLLSLLTRVQSPEVQVRAASGSSPGKAGSPPIFPLPGAGARRCLLSPWRRDSRRTWAEAAPERCVCFPLCPRQSGQRAPGSDGKLGQTSVSPLTAGETDRLPVGVSQLLRGMHLIAVLNPFPLSLTPTWAQGCNSPIPALNPGQLPVTACGVGGLQSPGLQRWRRRYWGRPGPPQALGALHKPLAEQDLPGQA